MLKIIVSQWDENEKALRETLSKMDLSTVEYKDLVRIAFDVVYNRHLVELDALDTDHITEIDNGDYQGTLLYLIPFDCYQPGEYEYLMTYVGYGSCSVCDTLQALQCDLPDDGFPSEDNVKDFMVLCKDILTNTIKPYNGGWRQTTDLFDHTEGDM